MLTINPIRRIFKKFFFRIYIAPLVFFSFITTVVIFSWFRYGHIYGGGDVGLPSYAPERILEIAKYIWWEASAPGTTVPQGLTSVPFQYFQTLLKSLSFPPFLIQASVFWILFFLAAFGMYLLGLSVFGKSKFYLAVLTSIFYIFNPFVMVQVWHRFIHNSIFLYSSLPFFYLFLSKWIKNGKYSWLLLFILSNLFFVYLYGTLAFSITVLVLLLFISFFQIGFPWRGLSFMREVIKRTFIGLAAWLAIQSWWLLPVLNVSPDILTAQHSILDNLSTLLSISSQTILPYSLLGINPYYLYLESDFGEIYDSLLFRASIWLPLVFLVPGFIKGLGNKKLVFWAILAITGIFLSKGATSPFGYPYILGFTHVFPLGVLRNPFEKLGMLIPFSSAILLTGGVVWYFSVIKKFRFLVRILITCIVVVILTVNLWPMWLGKIFGKIEKLAFVEVPHSYIEADQYIKNTGKEGRILHLPLNVSESIKYNWQFGYTGVEPSQLLFKSLPSISHGFNRYPVDDALTALSHIFLTSDSAEKILYILQSFSVRYIVLHKEVEWRGGYLKEPNSLELYLNTLFFLVRKEQLGDLIIYELKDQYFSPKLRLSNDFTYLIPSKSNTYWPWMLSSRETDFLSSLQGKNEDILLTQAKDVIILPEEVYKYEPQKIVKENLLGEMPAAKVLPDSPLYMFIKIKEKFTLFTLPANQKFSFQVTQAGKRLTESYLLKQKKPSSSTVSLLKEYQENLLQIREGIKARSNGREQKGEISVNFTVSRHLAILKLIREKAIDLEKQLIEETMNMVSDLMRDANITPANKIIEGHNLSTSERLVSKFNIPDSGKYELFQARQQAQKVYPNDLSKNVFQINSEIKELNGIVSDQFISFGKIDLTQGENEISFDAVPSINLAKLNENSVAGQVVRKGNEIEISSGDHAPSYIELEMDNIFGGNEYYLTFDSWIKLGDKFSIMVIQDTDPYDPKKREKQIPSYDNDFPKNPYQNYWVDNFFKFYINPATTKATIRIVVEPWDGCKYLLAIKALCLDEKIKYRYEQRSQTLFRNLTVVRRLTNPIFLKLDLATHSATFSEKVDFAQKNATSYSGSFTLDSAGFFLFNETFHPDWQLQVFNGKRYVPAQRFLSNLYGNAWFLDKPGEYKFTLDFIPQKNVKVGIIVAIFCIIIITTLTIREYLRR